MTEDGKGGRRRLSNEVSSLEATISASFVTPSKPRPVGQQTSASELVGNVVGGRYRLEHHLATGGMGSVYVATHLELAMRVAVKVMLPQQELAPGFSRRFAREARVLSKLSHRNVVRILDFGVESPHPYIVMELLEGTSVANWLDGLPALPSLRVVDELMRHACDGLSASHQAGIIHRDLKPDNLFVTTESDGTRLLKLIDFGVAHYDDPIDSGPALTRANAIFGTPEYMSPEQCQSIPVGPSTDIYALGCILTELLQGSPPFKGETQMAVMTQQMYLAAPELVRPPASEPIPPLLERLRQEMLAKDPNQRPQSTDALRLRWIEALAPEKNAARFPGRKRDSDGQALPSRLPNWMAPEPVVARSLPNAVEPIRLSVVQLAGDAGDAIDESQIVGLAAAGVRIVVPGFLGPNEPRADLHLVLAGSDVEGAKSWLTEHKTWAPQTLVSVRATASELGHLVAAGAGDVIDFPLDSPAAIRKLRRLRRRQRRRANTNA